MDLKSLSTKIKKIKLNSITDLISNFRGYYFSALGILVVVSVYHVIFANKLIPGVTIAGIKMGGLSYEQAVERLSEYESITPKEIKITYDGREYKLSGSDIDLEYDWEATVNRAFEVGRTRNFFVDSKDKIAGIFKRLYIPAYYDFKEEEYKKFIAGIKGDINISPENARYLIKNENELIISDELIGKSVDDQKLHDDLIFSFDRYDFGSKSIAVEDESPEVLKSDLEKEKVRAEEIIFSPLSLKYEDKEWNITQEQKLDFLNYDVLEKQLGFNKVAYRTFIDAIAPEVNQLPRGKVTSTTEGGRVLSFQLIQDGVEIDKEETMESFKDAYFDEKNVAEIKVNNITGAVDPKDYGIFALLGEGRSKFTGSAAGRIHNLTLATERVDGVLVPPDGIFSFNEAVGEITAETGYDAAWVIMGNKTVLGHGGGVCQVSTTMFRTILDAGLPVVTRHPHAYRVYYYEIESALGLDASVYQPSLDLQFKNDTPNYVLVQTSHDQNEQELVFRIYGTPDGRQVDISEPLVTNVSGAPAPKYQDDPTLPKGVVKQIDFAAGGATAVFTRTVSRGEDVLYEDTFRTNYQPWQAVFLVGTKED